MSHSQAISRRSGTHGVVIVETSVKVSGEPHAACCTWTGDPHAVSQKAESGILRGVPTATSTPLRIASRTESPCAILFWGRRGLSLDTSISLEIARVLARNPGGVAPRKARVRARDFSDASALWATSTITPSTISVRNPFPERTTTSVFRLKAANLAPPPPLPVFG